METTGYRYAYEVVPPWMLSACDLRDEACRQIALNRPVVAARITRCAEDGRAWPELADALYLAEDGRIGIAWGSYADWADAPTLAAGIDLWVTDPEEFGRRN